MSLNRALLLVDLQNDFLPGGALAVPDGLACVAVANELMQYHRTYRSSKTASSRPKNYPNYRLVLASQDWHPHDHMSFASQHKGFTVGQTIQWKGAPQVLWPDHCIRGTWGAALSHHLKVAHIDSMIVKGEESQIDSYSAFYDNARERQTMLTSQLNQKQIVSLDVLGLATDYCVKATVLDALASGFDVRLIEAGCRGVEFVPGDCDRAIQEMVRAGAHLFHGTDFQALA